MHQLLLKCAGARGLSTKRQRRFVKYHAQIEGCGQDVKALGRFVDAQVTAFRKILKKYKVCSACVRPHHTYSASTAVAIAIAIATTTPPDICSIAFTGLSR